jgi:hypothetical protein
VPSLRLKLFAVFLNELVSSSRKESVGDSERSQFLSWCRDVCIVASERSNKCATFTRNDQLSFVREPCFSSTGSPMYRVANSSNWYCHSFNEDDYRTDFSFF